MIKERTEYYAKPGLEEQVLAIRREACAVRRDLGLPSGQIFTRGEGSDPEGPDVVWECRFANAEQHSNDLAARDASDAFSAVRERMRQHIHKFARHFLRQDQEPIANGMHPVDLDGLAIGPREVSFESAGFELKGYYFRPPGPGPFPCMIANHGSGIERGSPDVSRPGAAAVLLSWGIASFLPHRRGYGNSEGPAWREQVTAEFGTAEYDRQLVARLESESEDVVAACDCVAALAEIDADHIGVIGSSFGGINTLLAAARDRRFRCAVEFAGAAMNWDRTPLLRRFMLECAQRLTRPIFFIQAENDYSIRPTKELSAAAEGRGVLVWSRIYPTFGINNMEAHLLESRGSLLWADEVHRFLECHL
jgi:dienelactone hydrolase